MSPSARPSGAITDIPGIRVGHYTDPAGATGCTVILCPAGTVGGVDVRGSAPGTRETDLLRPTMLGPAVNAIVLAGGSAFGLDAATGVVRFLAERGVGFPTGVALVPIVPAAVIFDLALGDPTHRPDAAAGYAACLAATAEPPAEGSVGAGTGAAVGKLLGMPAATKGGLGTAAITLPSGNVVGAIAVVNALGDVVDPRTGRILAGARAESGFADSTALFLGGGHRPSGWRSPTSGENTTLACVATSAVAGRDTVTKLAQLAHDGYARAIRPCHLMQDGDTVFALATGSGVREDPNVLAVAATEVVALAIVRAVTLATSLAGVPAAADLPGAGADRG